MANSVDDLQYDPEPHEPSRCWPIPPHGKQQTPESKGHERAVDDYEPKLGIRRNDAAQKSGGRKGLPEPSDIFFGRMRDLSEDQRGKSELDARLRVRGQVAYRSSLRKAA